jgi:cell division protein FtsI (penicillin-binding protein 3)
VGFVPADRPRVVILVLIDEPGTSSFGGVVAAPVFSAIASGVLKRLGVETPLPAVQMASAAAPKRTPPAAPRRVRSRTAPDAPSTPSFIGLSRREAVARARASGWDVQVTGIGYVREQMPAPGTPLVADRRLALRLVPDAAGLLHASE